MVGSDLTGLALAIVFGAGIAAYHPPAAREIVQGNGPAVQVGDLVTVNFEVRSRSGKQLAGTLKRGLPYSFVFGDPRQPRMWQDALRGLGVGGERWCVVPPERAFGQAGVPPVVPPGASLYLHVWLEAVRHMAGTGTVAQGE